MLYNNILYIHNEEYEVPRCSHRVSNSWILSVACLCVWGVKDRVVLGGSHYIFCRITLGALLPLVDIKSMIILIYYYPFVEHNIF
jgi:hypothetical protein